MNPVGAIWPPGLDSPPYDEHDDDIRREFEALTIAQAHGLADRATRVLETRRSERSFDEGDHARMAAQELLIRLVCYVPGSLEPVYGRLLDVDVLHSAAWGDNSMLFHDAGAEVRDRLIELDDDISRAALAWIDDEAVRRAMLEWAPDGADDCARSAGWALRHDGGRERLHVTTCHRLRPEAGLLPLGVLDSAERCGGCGDTMTAVFRLDLTDSRLGFLGLAGDTRTVLTCERCVAYGTVYAEVDDSGGARWSDASEHAAPPGDWERRPHRGALGLGAARPRPFSGRAFDVWHSSQLGGTPLWVQNPAYPICPGCAAYMPYLGQVQMDEAGDDDQAVGTIFAFHCVGCATVATVYQQT